MWKHVAPLAICFPHDRMPSKELGQFLYWLKRFPLLLASFGSEGPLYCSEHGCQFESSMQQVNMLQLLSAAILMMKVLVTTPNMGSLDMIEKVRDTLKIVCSLNQLNVEEKLVLASNIVMKLRACTMITIIGTYSRGGHEQMVDG